MPKGTEDQVGFLAPQSKHIWLQSAECAWNRTGAADLVGGLGLELLENLLRLLLSGRHDC